MKNLTVKFSFGKDKKYRFTVLLENKLIVTNGHASKNLKECIEDFMNSKFVEDPDYIILDNTTDVMNYIDGVITVESIQ